MNLLIKPASGACNMRCRYCFYADEMAHREKAVIGMMSVGTLEVIVRRALETAERECCFMFQGGEPTLAGIEFYRKLIGFTSGYNTRRLRVSYAIQTNGFALDEDWAELFTRNKFLVGLSLDGPRELHDLNRRAAGGRGSFDEVMRTVALFDRHGVDYNILSVVTGESARRAVSIYNFFASKKFRYQQYIPCLDGFDADPTAPRALTAKQYATFLRRIFDVWYADISSGKYVYNRTFENWMSIMLGRLPESCGMAGFCSPQYTIEADGSVYPCDFYVLDGYRLGNLLTDSFADLDRRRDELGFVERSRKLPDECSACRWLPLCRGGCYRERIGGNGEAPPKNRFCETYREFFPYAADRLAAAARMLTSPGYGS